MRRQTIFGAALLAPLLASIMLLAASCSGDKGGQQEARKEPAKTAVKTAPVEVHDAERTVEATGALYAWEDVVVSSEVAGTVEKIAADLGDKVSAGSPLATLDRKEARLNLADARAAAAAAVKAAEKERARMTDAAATLKRYEELHKQAMVSDSQYDNAKTQSDVAAAALNEAESRLQSAEARLSIAEKRFADTIVTSPIDGHVSRRMVSAGESVKERMPLFAVVSIGKLKFRGTVPEASAGAVKPGQKLQLSVEAHADRVFSGELNRVSPAVTPETRTLDVEGVVPNPDGLLKPGFFAAARVAAGFERAAAFVPASAVRSFAGVTKVFVIESGIARERIVRLGRKRGELVEVVGQVKPGEAVAVSALDALYDGAPVGAAK